MGRYGTVSFGAQFGLLVSLRVAGDEAVGAEKHLHPACSG